MIFVTELRRVTIGIGLLTMIPKLVLLLKLKGETGPVGVLVLGRGVMTVILVLGGGVEGDGLGGVVVVK